MRPKIDISKLKHLPTTEDMFVDEYGAKGTVSRDEFDAKSRAWYYAEVLKDARKSAGITQQQLADKIEFTQFGSVHYNQSLIVVASAKLQSNPKVV